MMMVEVYKPGLQFYADKLRAGEPFSLVRYGNGEWDCILSLRDRTNSGSQHFTPALRAALAETLTVERGGDYYTGLQSTDYLRRLGLLNQAEAWLKAHGIERQWHDGEVLHKASAKGQLQPFVAAMRTRRVVVVGPPWLMALPFASAFIPVQPRDCWGQIDKIEREIRSAPRGAVISISAGPAAKVLIHRLYPDVGQHSWLLDCGSLWDPYCGVQSRRYHSRVTPEVIKRNLRYDG